MKLELTTQELDTILIELIDTVRYKDDNNIMKSFTKQLFEYRNNIKLRQPRIIEKWQPILNSIFFHHNYNMENLCNYCDNFDKYIMFSNIDKDTENLLPVNIKTLSQLKIDYVFTTNIEECDKFEISREIKENNSIQEIEEFLLNEIVNHINSLNNIQIYKLISSIYINNIDDRQWLCITCRFKK